MERRQAAAGIPTALDDCELPPPPPPSDGNGQTDEPLPPPPTAENMLEIEAQNKEQAIKRCNAAELAHRAADAAFKAAVNAKNGNYRAKVVLEARKVRDEAKTAFDQAVTFRYEALASYNKAAENAEGEEAKRVADDIPALEATHEAATEYDPHSPLVACTAGELSERACNAFWNAVATATGQDLRAALTAAELAMVAELNKSMVFVDSVCRTMRQGLQIEGEDTEAIMQTDRLTRIALGTLGHASPEALARWPSAADVFDRIAHKSFIYTMWATSQERRRADYVAFCPHPLTCPATVYNTWTGFGMAPGGGNPDGNAAKAFIRLVHRHICCGDERLYASVMSWCAHLVQRPGDTRAQWALVLCGKKGAGKLMLYHLLRRIVGGRYCRLATSKMQVVGRFCRCIENTLLIALDELVWASSREENSALNKLVTEKWSSIKRKGIDAYTVRNCARVMIVSNADWVVPATGDERRFMVCDMSNELAAGEGKIVWGTLNRGIEDVAALLYAWEVDESLLTLA